MRSELWRSFPAGEFAVAMIVWVFIAVACAFESSLTVKVVCRGDTVTARDSISLVRCATLDSLAKIP